MARLYREEAARLLGLQPEVVTKAANSGFIPVFEVDFTRPGGGSTGTYVYRQEDLERLIPLAQKIKYFTNYTYNYRKGAPEKIRKQMYGVPVNIAADYLGLLGHDELANPYDILAFCREQGYDVEIYNNRIFVPLYRIMRHLDPDTYSPDPFLGGRGIDGEAVRRRMREMHLPQRVLAGMLGISQRRLRQALKGETTLAPKHIKQIARILGLDEGEITR